MINNMTFRNTRNLGTTFNSSLVNVAIPSKSTKKNQKVSNLKKHRRQIANFKSQKLSNPIDFRHSIDPCNKEILDGL